MIGRLKPGITLAVANAQLQASYKAYKEKHSVPFDFPQTGCGVQALQDAIVGSLRNSLLILVRAADFVPLIACANVANLLLAWSELDLMRQLTYARGPGFTCRQTAVSRPEPVFMLVYGLPTIRADGLHTLNIVAFSFSIRDALQLVRHRCPHRPLIGELPAPTPHMFWAHPSP